MVWFAGAVCGLQSVRGVSKSGSDGHDCRICGCAYAASPQRHHHLLAVNKVTIRSQARLVSREFSQGYLCFSARPRILGSLFCCILAFEFSEDFLIKNAGYKNQSRVRLGYTEN